MTLKQIDWKNYTTETNVFTFSIPGVPENVATIEVTTSETKTTGEKRTNTQIKKVLKGNTPKILKECRPVFVKPSFFEFIKTKSIYSSRAMYEPDQETYEKIYKVYKNEKYFSCTVRDAICSILYCRCPQNHHDWLGIAPFLKNPPGQLSQDS